MLLNRVTEAVPDTAVVFEYGRFTYRPVPELDGAFTWRKTPVGDEAAPDGPVAVVDVWLINW